MLLKSTCQIFGMDDACLFCLAGICRSVIEWSNEDYPYKSGRLCSDFPMGSLTKNKRTMMLINGPGGGPRYDGNSGEDRSLITGDSGKRTIG